jgi:prephenate dehydrogenase
MPEQSLFRRAAVLGLGLMGGSLCLALRAAGLVGAIAGYDISPETRAEALRRGVVDEVRDSPEAAVRDADLVVLAAPVLALCELCAQVAPALIPDTLVTDLASTKVDVVAWAKALLPSGCQFVGSHPMCGSERSGIAAAVPSLFAGRVWCLTPDAATPPEALARAEALVRALDAEPLVLAPEVHDRAVAWISHLPLVAAAALARSALGRPEWPLLARLAAGGFRDGTRVAAGDPRMARDICLSNREPLLAALDAFLEELAALRGEIARGDPAIETRFEAARNLRTRLPSA